MNDSSRSVTVSLGILRVSVNSSGRKTRPGIGASRLASGRGVVRTLVATAWPATLREAVPVAVIGAAGEAGALARANVCDGFAGRQGEQRAAQRAEVRPLFGATRPACRRSGRRSGR